jgi:hypothetical protein
MVGRGPAVRVTPLKSRMFCEVCFWTETDLPRGLCDVWCWGINGHGAVRPNLLSLTQFGHQRTSFYSCAGGFRPINVLVFADMMLLPEHEGDP